MEILEENKENVVHLETNQLPDQVLKNLRSGSINIECFINIQDIHYKMITT